jgi:AraC-like DNA-binding protein
MPSARSTVRREGIGRKVLSFTARAYNTRLSISSTLVKRAEIEFHEAAEPLRSKVGCFWVVTAERGATIRVVPDGSTSVSIELRNGRAGGWFLRGPLVQPHQRRFNAPATLVGVRLRPGVAFLVTDIAASSMVGCHIGLRDVPSCAALAADKSPLETPTQCIDVLQRFLINRLGNVEVHGVVAQALQAIEGERGSVGVADVAARCGISVRHLNRLMRRWVGYGAKRYGRIARFQATLDQIDQSPTTPAATLASDTGYFDQAHLTLDLSRLAGATPVRLATTSVADFSKTRCDDSL